MRLFEILINIVFIVSLLIHSVIGVGGDDTGGGSGSGGGDNNSRLGKDRKLWWFVIRRPYMRNDAVLNILRIGLVRFAARHRIAQADIANIRSEYLGTFFFTLELDYSIDTQEVWDQYKEYLISYGEVPYALGPKDIQEHLNVKLKPKPEANIHKGKQFKNATIAARGDYDGIDLIGASEKRDLAAVGVFEEPFDEMRKLSQPPGINLQELHGLYFRRKHAEGEGVTVYVPDSGALVGEARTHKVLRSVRIEDYLWAEPNPHNQRTDTNRNDYHGTAVISKIAGRRIGTAPKAGIVVVQCSSMRGETTTAHYFSALLKIYDHIREMNPKASIINISWTFDTIDPTDEKMAKIVEVNLLGRTPTNTIIELYSYFLMGEFAKLRNVKIVGAAGNRYPGTELGFPHRHAQAYPHTMIAVGGTGVDNRNKFQRSTGMRVWAPATQIHVAGFDENGVEALELAEGTSFAAPTVTGIMATLLSEGIRVDDVVELIYKLAHKRVPNGPPIVWNGIYKQEWPRYNGDQERQEEYELP
ncbi:hypothetical protein TWF281_006348 [Arthrobotrys megalospora]